jgi:hypothetical protein
MKMKLNRCCLVTVFLLIVIALIVRDQYAFRIMRLFDSNKVVVSGLTIEVPGSWAARKQGNTIWIFSAKDGETLLNMRVGEGKFVSERIQKLKSIVERHNGYLIRFKIQDFPAYEMASVKPDASESVVTFWIQRGEEGLSISYYGRVAEKYKNLNRLLHSIKNMPIDADKNDLGK